MIWSVTSTVVDVAIALLLVIHFLLIDVDPEFSHRYVFFILVSCTKELNFSLLFFYIGRLVHRSVNLAIKTGTSTALNTVIIVIKFFADQQSNGTHILILFNMHSFLTTKFNHL
jgi:hypothetical protein